jgi:NAD-dependent deacetylase sirtuin 3
MCYRSVIVMSGAGISTPSGIPDFRTPGTGLYDNLQKYQLPEPSAVFDAVYFNHNPRPFFSLAKELYPGKYSPNLVHCFVRLLQDKGVLLRNYTQNIDGLERLAGVQGGKLVEAHGSFSTASCTRCHSKHDPEEVKNAIFSDRIPRCKHKYCSGVVKPNIVFFGEDLPQRFHSLKLPDFSKCDLLLVMGTSLEVEPFASLVTLSRHSVPRLLFNREMVGPFRSSRCRHTDVTVRGDVVESVRVLVQGAGWEVELEDIQRTVSKDMRLHAAAAAQQTTTSTSSSRPAKSGSNAPLSSALRRMTLQSHPPQTTADSDSSDSSSSSHSTSSSLSSDSTLSESESD